MFVFLLCLQWFRLHGQRMYKQTCLCGMGSTMDNCMLTRIRILVSSEFSNSASQSRGCALIVEITCTSSTPLSLPPSQPPSIHIPSSSQPPSILILSSFFSVLFLPSTSLPPPPLSLSHSLYITRIKGILLYKMTSYTARCMSCDRKYYVHWFAPAHRRPRQ